MHSGGLGNFSCKNKTIKNPIPKIGHTFCIFLAATKKIYEQIKTVPQTSH
jgi:hypothetical protein